MVGVTAEQRKWRRQYDPTGQNAGDVPSSDGAGGIVWQPAASGAQRIEAFKTADQTKTNDNTLNADNALSFVLDANSHYRIEAMVEVENPNTTPDFKFRWLAFTGTWYLHYDSRRITVSTGAAVGTNLFSSHGNNFTTDSVIAMGNAQRALIHFDILVHTGGPPNNFFLNWAQNVSNANPTTVKAGSWAIATKIA